MIVRRVPIALLTVCAAVACTTPAAAKDHVGCADSVHVSWQTDASANRVLAAVMQVSGCADRTTAGLDLQLDRAPRIKLPSMDLLSGTAVFDLRPLDVELEAVVGVRVTVQGRRFALPPTVPVTVPPPPRTPPGSPIEGVVDEAATAASPTPGPSRDATDSPTEAGTGGAKATVKAAPRLQETQPAQAAAAGSAGSARPLSLPFSGASLMSTTLAGLLLLISGGGLLATARRGRPRQGS